MKIKYNIVIVSGLALLLMAPVESYAQKLDKTLRLVTEESMDRYDNRDSINSEEIHNAFRSMDKDENGTISQEEFSASVVGQFHRLDIDRNGVVDENEFYSTNRQQFKKLDKNNDGTLSEAEFTPSGMNDNVPELRELMSRQKKEVRELAIRHQKELESLEAQLKKTGNKKKE